VQSLGLRSYPEAVQKAHLQYTTLPIVDMCAPDNPQVACAFVDELAERVCNRERVLIHCRCVLHASPNGERESVTLRHVEHVH
jgi:protein-tyrosine phosphatase